MEDSSDPIKEHTKPYSVELVEDQIEYTFELAPNEFNNYDDSLGLFQQPPKVLNFLTVESQSTKILESGIKSQANISFKLSDKQRT